MHLTQGDLFWGMDIDFVKTATDLAVNISCKNGDRLFGIGDRADYFYVLLKGSVVMERGKDRLYTANHAGEIFGWSALIRRKDYAASATCNSDTELLKIEQAPFLSLLEASPQNKSVLYEGLSKMLGNQLLEVYISSTC
jgi:CRP/FNR family transcriptional regulator, cyclic AMP receptor protein